MKLFQSFLILLIGYSIVYPQSDTIPGYITVIPNERYAANGLHELFFGRHWRDVWTTPVKVEILDLENFSGGIVPTERGGGMQTKSLRFVSKDNKIWKFRSIDKDPSKVLPEALQESIAEHILKDQISSANPYAALVVSPILKSLNILEAEPKLVFLPDDERLGEFREEFGGILGFIEEHPSEGENDLPGFENALDVKGTYKLFDHLAEKRSQKIDAEEFLKARLIDILLGDWDRHMDQWRWAKYEEIIDGKSKDIWKPIPRDRDQVFSKYDGLFPSIADYIVPQITHFSEDYPQMEDLTWNGRFLDRRVLTELDKQKWDSVTVAVQVQVTDELIDSSLKMLPPEVHDICASEISYNLKSRRDSLQWASDQLYGLVNKYADVFCSNEDDYVELNRLDDKSTVVTIYRRDKSTSNAKGDPLFHKVFDNKITKDLRIHLDDGDDKTYIFGECSEAPVIRVIGGKGRDEFIDESIVYGYFLSITPFTASQGKTYFYDSGKHTSVVLGPGTTFDDSFWPEPEDDFEKYEPQQRDRGHDWLPVPIIGLDTDYGLTIGGGIQLNQFSFRAVPKDYMQQVTFSYATRFGNFAAAYEGDFYSVVRDGRLNLLVAATEQFVTRYFGYGNETTYDDELEINNYYETNQKLITFFPTIHYGFTERLTGSFGVSFIHTNTSLKNDTLLTGFKYGDYGLGTQNPFGIHLAVEVDEKDHQEYPTAGYWMNFYGKIFPGVFDIPESFYQAGFDLRTYLTPSFTSFATFALRAGGSKMLGKYPFYAGATVGGENNLRGYNHKRFSGDAALFGQAELRLFVTQINIILKSRTGINLFAETGRVFTENDTSDKWHLSYGVGILVSYLNSLIIGSTYIAFSQERTTFHLGLGMAF
ncbi:MAG: BamA/TamA family outer membrane protein [bacterium]|nr:BamA/TamA family outer membrane protein [bacterium]